MAKRSSPPRGLNAVADSQERAEHNMNPYYWTNRITLMKIGAWRSKRFAVAVFLFFNLFLGLLWLGIDDRPYAIKIFLEIVKPENAVHIFDNAQNLSGFLSGVVLLLIWLYAAIGSIREIRSWIQARYHQVGPQAFIARKRQVRKKYPRRPKNYGHH